MKIYLFLLFFVSSTLILNAQEAEDDFDFEEDETEEITGLQYNGSEIGADIAFSASTFGGNFGIGLKYGFKLGKYLFVGPSVRYERLWFKNALSGFNGNSNVFGGGAFVHARFFNVLFLGVEYEHLLSPYNRQGFLQTPSTWAPTLFVGGGFSMSFNERIRLNVGLMYDVINAENSPFRNSYSITVKDQNGNIQRFLPIIYRVAFFFPLS